ncbi:MAG: integrin alpha [Bacteroidota bacterium]
MTQAIRTGLVCLTAILFLPVLHGQQVANRERIFYEHVHHVPDASSQLPKMPPKGRFGQGIAAIGDLDGDGITEVAAGAPGLGTGALSLLYLNAEGGIKKHQKLDLSVLKALGGPSPGGKFGYCVEAAGDWDQDGTPDILVGEPGGKSASCPTAVSGSSCSPRKAASKRPKRFLAAVPS